MKPFTSVLRLTFWLVAMFAVVFLCQAQLGNKRLATTQQTKTSVHAIQIVDQNGKTPISGVPSGGQTFDVAVGQTGFTFDPDELNISVGDTVSSTGVAAGTTIVNQLTSTETGSALGGRGTYTVSGSAQRIDAANNGVWTVTSNVLNISIML